MRVPLALAVVAALAVLILMLGWGTPERSAGARLDVDPGDSPSPPVVHDGTLVAGRTGSVVESAGSAADLTTPGTKSAVVVHGWVNDERGEPVSEGRVSLQSFFGPIERTIVNVPVSGVGSFKVELPRSTAKFSIRAQFSSERYVSRVRTLVVEHETHELSVSLTARPALELRVRVVDGGGSPVEGASVRVSPEMCRVLGTHDLTGTGGQVAVRAPEGRLSVLAWKGSAYGRAALTDASREGQELVVRLADGLLAVSVEFLPQPSSFRSGERVSVAVRGGLEGVLEGVVGADPVVFHILPLSFSGRIGVVASLADGVRIVEEVDVKTRSDTGVIPVRIVVSLQTRVRLTLVSESGEPLRNQRLLIRPDPTVSRSATRLIRLSTRRSGEVEIRGLAPGRYQLAVLALGAHASGGHWVEFDVPEGESVRRLECRDVGVLNVTYVGPARVRNARVAVFARLPDADGARSVAELRAVHVTGNRYALFYTRGVAGSRLQIVADSHGQEFSRLETRVGARQEERFGESMPFIDVTIRVRNGEKTRVTGYVWVVGHGLEGRRETSSTYIRDEDGHAVFRGLLPGTYRVYFGSEPSIRPGPNYLGEAELTEGRSDYEFDLVLQR